MKIPLAAWPGRAVGKHKGGIREGLPHRGAAPTGALNRIPRQKLDRTAHPRPGLGEERLSLRHKMATMSLKTRHAVSIPDYLRLRMEPFLRPGACRGPRSAHSQRRDPPNSFRSPQLVRFAHCDAAGIVFYPRYFDMMNSAQEDWFDQGLGCPWGTDLMGPRNLRIPPLAITVEFLAGCRLSEVIDFHLWVTRLGHRSLELALEGRVAGKPRLRATMTSCMVDSGTSGRCRFLKTCAAVCSDSWRCLSWL